MKVYLASDHAGFETKNALVAFVRELGHEVEDCGADAFDKDDDYPAIIARAARKLSDDVATKRESRAIVLGGSGQGEAIVANKFKGVRCALYYGEANIAGRRDMSGKVLTMIDATREHNNANALSIGARFVDAENAKQVVRRWLELPFSGEERHARRIKQIDEVA